MKLLPLIENDEKTIEMFKRKLTSRVSREFKTVYADDDIFFKYRVIRIVQKNDKLSTKWNGSTYQYFPSYTLDVELAGRVLVNDMDEDDIIEDSLSGYVDAGIGYKTFAYIRERFEEIIIADIISFARQYFNIKLTYEYVNIESVKIATEF